MGMHTLTITAAHHSARQLRKEARSLAMTGGFELALDTGLTSADLQVLTESLLPALDEYPADMRRRTNLVYRVLDLVQADCRCPELMRERILERFRASPE